MLAEAGLGSAFWASAQMAASGQRIRLVWVVSRRSQTGLVSRRSLAPACSVRGCAMDGVVGRAVRGAVGVVEPGQQVLVGATSAV